MKGGGQSVCVCAHACECVCVLLITPPLPLINDSYCVLSPWRRPRQGGEAALILCLLHSGLDSLACLPAHPPACLSVYLELLISHPSSLRLRHLSAHQLRFSSYLLPSSQPHPPYFFPLLPATNASLLLIFPTRAPR